jgi:putative FmdB family regulatory protein
MPLYEYQCDACAHRFEKIQKFSDPIVDTCPVCSGPVRKLQSSPAFQFKGTGFYITDYVKKDQGAGEKSDSGSADKADTADKAAKSDSGSSKSDKTNKPDKAAAPGASEKSTSSSSAASSSDSSAAASTKQGTTKPGS